MTYTCPMHPQVQQETAGMCPECGMNLVRGSGVGHTHGAMPAPRSPRVGVGFARKFWVSLALTTPVVLTSEVAGQFLGLDLARFPRLPVVTAVVSSVVFFYGGGVFLVGALRELKGRLPGMMTLIALAILTAYLYSLAVTFTGQGEPLFWELTTLITIMLLGHMIEMRAVQGAQGALRELTKLLPDTAEVVHGEHVKTVPVAGLRVGDRVLVRPGGRIPADGAVEEGTSDVNEALVTGESTPVTKTAGSPVIAGAINGDGVLRVRVTEIGGRTFLAGIMRMVAEAQASKSRLQVLADRAAFALTIIAVVSGVVTLIAWLAVGAGIGNAIERVVAVLVIACPHALGLAVPLVASISTTIGARHGLLVRQRLALEMARRVTVVLFDKTGTLTRGEFGVERVWAFMGREDETLRLAASVDAPSEHVIAKAVVREAQRRGLSLLPAADVVAIPGQGVRGTIGGETVTVGGHSLLRPAARLPEPHAPAIEQAQAAGRSVVFVRRGERLVGAITLTDVVREESRVAVRDLQALGARVAMVTGDTEGVARWVAGELGIREIFARVSPGEKAVVVRRLQDQGQRVAFVGDGINDAPALTQADVGIAIGAGTNVAIESAGILLVRSDPRDVVHILRLSQVTYRTMLQNLFWATGYNLVALPLAAGVLASQGILLAPAVSALFMSVSTVIVAVNALLLRRVRF